MSDDCVLPVSEGSSDGRYPRIDQQLLDPHNVLGRAGVLPGMDGIPFRGPIPDLKEKDPKQPEVGFQAFVRVFNLADKEDLAYYEKIYQLAYNGSAMITLEERKYDEQIQSWRILVRWVSMYSYLPQDVPHRNQG